MDRDNTPVWSSGNGGNTKVKYRLLVQDNGKLVLRDNYQNVIWTASA